MTSPLLDEENITQALQAPVDNIESLRALQTGAVMLIMDAYDREATRDFMMTAVTAACNLLTDLGKLWMIEQVKTHALDHGAASLVNIEQARQSLIPIVTQMSQEALQCVDLLKQCPGDWDPIS